eukprot:6025948-Prymnesium_polylepis.1
MRSRSHGCRPPCDTCPPCDTRPTMRHAPTMRDATRTHAATPPNHATPPTIGHRPPWKTARDTAGHVTTRPLPATRTGDACCWMQWSKARRQASFRETRWAERRPAKYDRKGSRRPGARGAPAGASAGRDRTGTICWPPGLIDA